MKKALLILLALSIVGAAAFADVKFGAFASIGLRADYNMNVGGVSGTNSDNLYAWEWFQGTPLIGLATASFVGSDPNMGFDTRFIVIPGGGIPGAFEAPSVGNVDYANAWMKLANGMVALNLGLFQAAEDFETAEQAYGQNTWNTGAQVSTTIYAYPIEGLTIGYQLPLATSLAPAATIADTLYGSKFGVRYTMKDVFSVTGGFLLGKGTFYTAAADNYSDAYFGVSVKAIPNLGLWVEGLMKNIGDSTTYSDETDLYVEANYAIMDGLKAGVAFEYNILDASNANVKANLWANAWVAEPYVIYTVMENFNLMGAVDIGSASALGSLNVWGWYGLQTGGPAAGSATSADGLAWDVFVRASLMSPLGELRIQARYGQYATKVPAGITSPARFDVFAGVKWGF